MSDADLVALAAKAFGDAPDEFSPLTDDGDALRLAVKLRLECVYPANGDDKCVCQYWICNEGFEQVIEEINGNPYAATRRAIVRAAAEIGRSME